MMSVTLEPKLNLYSELTLQVLFVKPVAIVAFSGKC